MVSQLLVPRQTQSTALKTVSVSRRRWTRLGLKQPENSTVTTVEQAMIESERIGFPLVVRPSYVLGGPRYGNLSMTKRIYVVT